MRLDDNLNEFNNRHPDKVHLWYQTSDESKKKLWILLLVIIAIAAINSWFTKEKNEKVKIERKKNTNQ